MSFLAPLAFWSAAIVIPALLILYFLKLRRRTETVPSTFLWRKAVQDMQVNAPFQKLRRNLLLLLQLLILAAAIFALARPIVESAAADAGSVVVLIDRSASMNTLEGEQTRFELAKQQAERLLRTLNQAGDSWLNWFGIQGAQTRAMVIAFSDRATVIAPFTTNTNDLARLVRDLEPTDAPTDIAEALSLAEAYMAQTTLEATTESAEEKSRIVLISDGAIRGAEEMALKAGSLTLIPVGETDQNVGITGLTVQRNYERPELLDVFVQIENFSATAATAEVWIDIDGAFSAQQPVSLGAARRDLFAEGSSEETDNTGAAASLAFQINLPTEAELVARLRKISVDDALKVDNSAAVIVPPPRKMRVLLVSAQNFFLEQMLSRLPLESFDYFTPTQYEAKSAAGEIATNGQSNWDLVYFDQYAPESLPQGNYFFIEALPPNEGLEIEEEIGVHEMQWWDDTHPILRYVGLDFLFAQSGQLVTVPDDAQILVEGPRGPTLFRFARDGRHYLVQTFAFERTNWPTKTSFVVYNYNLARYMGAGGALAQNKPRKPGDVLTLELPPDERRAILRRPDGSPVTIMADEFGKARYAGTEHVGVYTLEPAADGFERFAVNLLSAFESDIHPREEFEIASEIQVGEAIDTATPELWRWFVALALLLLFAEWYIYNRRVMI